MKISEIKNERLGESAFCGEHPSGLKVFVLPKKDYESAFALYGVKYGSIDTSIMNENGEYEAIPEGTAHFLEHKLFESEDLNAFERFAKTGASANAYTSFERTAYLFKSSSDITESLEILLDFVQNPYFTADTVEKEQGIIGQEIRMYQDQPGWQLMFNLLRALYGENPVRIDIAGTQESIARIDADLLHRLYKEFYNPANMALCVVGCVEPSEVFATVERCLKNNEGKKIERKFVREDEKPIQKYVEERFSVAEKQFYLGFKEGLSEPTLNIKDEVATSIMLDAVFGKSSRLFKELLDAELIDMGFDADLFNGYGFSCVMVGGTSADPEKAVELIHAELARLRTEGIDPAAFERARKKNYGRMVMSYNDVSETANLLMSLCFSGHEPFDELEACRSVTLEDAERRLALLREECAALSVISPIIKED